MIGDRYALEREIGRGGMGAVWLGRDRVLGREVAIKRVGVEPGSSAPDVERVEREARISAGLNHPNVVGVFDLVVHDGQHWLVMEYVAGTTLAGLINEHGRLEPHRAGRILADAASALVAAHAIGVVHRDVKPSNILVGSDGHVKLSDFGIARGETDPALTATGMVTGSPGYIAPEVAQGRPATRAGDVWSLGATAYHALAGQPAYEVGDNVLATLYKIVNEQPPRLDRDVWLEPFVTAAMSHDPDQRWAMSDVAGFLRSEGRRVPAAPVPGGPVPTGAHRGAPAAAAPPEPTELLTTTEAPRPAAESPRRRSEPSRRRGGWGILAALVALLVVVAFGGWLLVTGDDEQAPTAGESASPEPSPDESSPTEKKPKPRQQMRRFVQRYLTQADNAPEKAFDSLTPEYQQQSGGLDGYLGFWGGVSNVRDITIENVDVEGMTVTYSYTYDLAGSGRRDDLVRLSLVQPSPDAGYLISGDETLG